MAGKGIQAGKAYVEASLDATKLQRGLTTASQRIKAFGKTVSAVGMGMAKFGAMLLAPLALSVRQFVTAGDQIAKMAKRTGVSTEALSEFGFVAEQTGTDVVALEGAFKKMQRSIYDLGRGLSTQVDAFADLGLTYADLAGLKPEEQFARMADALGKMTNDTDQAAIAMALFGRAGTGMIPLFELGAEGIKKLRQEARQLGITLSAEDAAAAEELADAMNRLKTSVGAAAREIGAALAPAIEAIIKDLVDAAKWAGSWAKENGALIVSFAKIAAGITAVGLALVILGKTSAAIGGLGAMMTQLLTKTNAVIAALAVLAVSLVKLQSDFAFAAKAHKDLMAYTLWGGITYMDEVTRFEAARAAKEKKAIEDHYAAIEKNERDKVNAETMRMEGRWASEAALDAYIKQLAGDQLALDLLDIQTRKQAAIDVIHARGRWSKEEIWDVEKLYDLQADEARKQHAEREAAAEKERLAPAAAAAVADAEKVLEIEELKLRTTMTGIALEKALLKLQEKQALADALAAGQSLDLVKEEFALRSKLIDLEDQLQRQPTTLGTYSAGAFATLQGGGDGNIQKQILDANKDVVKNTKRIADAAEAGGLKFGD